MGCFVEKLCNICGAKISDIYYANVCADGVSSVSFLKVYGETYHLCSKCTYELSLFLQDLSLKKNAEKLNVIKRKAKILNIDDFRKK